MRGAAAPAQPWTSSARSRRQQAQQAQQRLQQRLRSTACRAKAPQTTEPAASQAHAAGQQPWAQPGFQGALVSSLPLDQQRAAFVGIAVALAAGTVLSCTVLGPALAGVLPGWLLPTRTSWFPLGPIFLAAGVAHFTERAGFEAMYPHTGAWGLWYLPGSARFHVEWTGVAEILGGLGLSLGALPFAPHWLAPASAAGLCALTAVVTPANIYMYTHNAPGPLPESATGSEPIPPAGHAARGLMQVLLLATLWGIATAP